MHWEEKSEMENEEKQIAQKEVLLQKMDWLIFNRHLPMLSLAAVFPYDKFIDSRNFFRLFPIKEIVYDKSENITGKLRTVFSGCASAGVNPVMIIEHNEACGKANFFWGACSESCQPDATAKADIFKRNLLGNFPGCKLNADADYLLEIANQRKLIDRCFSDEYAYIGCVSGVASERGDIKKDENRSFIQGIERVVNAMEDQCYSIMILSRALSNQEITEMQAQFENLYNALYPYLKTSYSVNSSSAVSEGDNLSKSISDMISKSFTVSTGKTENIMNSHSSGGSNSCTDGHSHQHGNSFGGNAGISIAEIFSVGGFYAHSTSGSDSHSNTRGKNWNDTLSKGNSTSQQESKTNTNGKTTTVVEGQNHTLTITEGKTLQITYENKIIQGLLSALEQKIQRLRDGKSQGMFETAAYFVTKDRQNASSVTSIFKAAVTGDNTCIEDSSINLWAIEQNSDLKKYLRNCQHPVFRFDDMLLKATSIVTAQEHAIQFGLPKSSVNGLHVGDSVAFARNVTVVNCQGIEQESFESRKDYVQLGKVYHLGSQEITPVCLDLQSLCSHSFVTGTTGCGKSNTVYWMLKRICEMNSATHFLVIEPAKGEYKAVFGDSDLAHPRIAGHPVDVYGTNPNLTPLLRINPFSFPKGIHVLEHIDKICAIFNVCWPMEAAMPSILKQAVVRAYQKAGWNLKTSRNRHNCFIFPSFIDVMEQINEILDSSDYSGENKGNYKGALCTRLQDLTTGLNTMIFGSNELNDEQLFERNVIVDLSRLGSDETKSLIMGLLLIRLQEYHQNQNNSSNLPLNHITVLEEAHNLLKRTSGPSQQSSEKANMVGKSVEMLSNSLAEMRSAGEGFLIVDQSPEQVDLSAIRNTNTKIVMRLPMFTDRKEIGQSMGLSDMQIGELAQLPDGVAAVYQNNWKAAVLVRIEKYHGQEKPYRRLDEDYLLDDEIELLNLVLLPKNRCHLIEELINNEGIKTIERRNVSLRCKELLLSIDKDTEIENSVFDELAFELLHVKELADEVMEIHERKNLSAESVADLWENSLQIRAEEVGITLSMEIILELTQRVYTRDPLFASCYNLMYNSLGKYQI